MRIEWSGGWAALVDRLTHARRMRIMKALPMTQSSDPAAMMEFASIVACAYIGSWSEGEVDPVTGPPIAALDGLPSDAVDALTNGSLEHWTSRADPNATTTGSDPGRSGSQSPALTRTSRTPSGS